MTNRSDAVALLNQQEVAAVEQGPHEVLGGCGPVHAVGLEVLAGDQDFL